jgi:lipopolysaccharide biosynthesis protein
MKIVLVEWAAYPLARNKLVGKQRIRCGLGRTLQNMARWPAGLPFEVLLVINRAEPGEPPKGLLGGARARLSHVLRRDEAHKVQRRMDTYANLPQRYPFVQHVHFRDNHGQDFGAYDLGYRLLQREGYEGDVLFMNSSVAGPHGPMWLAKYREQFRRHPNVGLCGISLNSHDTTREEGRFAPHVQSFFLYTNMQILKHAVGSRLFEVDAKDKLDVIAHGEIGISARVLDAGYGITSSMFPDFAYRKGEPWAIPYGDLRYEPSHAVPANRM